MSQKITLNPSIAACVNINGIGLNEIVPIYFTAESNWTGNFSFNIWYSSDKTNQIQITNSAITIFENRLTLTISPLEQKIPSGKFYFEINDDQTRRVIIKGDLIILK